MSLSVLTFAVTASAAAKPVRTADAACRLVKEDVSRARHMRSSAGEFCDIIPAAKSPPGLFVIGLHHVRSKEDCPDICSTSMGWFAVRKRTGEVREFDVNEWRMGPPIASH